MPGDLNALLWQGLLDHGAVAGQPLDVDAFFYARSAAAAKRVGQALESGGWRVGFSEPVRVGRWPTRREFPVTGRRLMPESSLEAFDELSASCRALAVRLGVDFDGLGAQIL